MHHKAHWQAPMHNLLNIIVAFASAHDQNFDETCAKEKILKTCNNKDDDH